LNPIEKLWRWLKQDLIHKHPFTDNITDLKQAVDAWLAQFQNGSQQLLKYVGLQGAQNIYTPALQTVFQNFPPPT